MEAKQPKLNECKAAGRRNASQVVTRALVTHQQVPMTGALDLLCFQRLHACYLIATLGNIVHVTRSAGSVAVGCGL